MKFKVYLYGIIIIIFFLLVNACRKAGLWLIKDDEIVKADAAILLTGSIADRIMEASDQYKYGNGRQVIIVEESMWIPPEFFPKDIQLIRNAEQARNSLYALGIPAERIILLPGDATSTQMEAMIIRRYLADKPDIDTLLLVTSSYHTRRASIIFKNAFRTTDKQVTIICSPSKYTSFNAEKWWKSKEGIQVVLLEHLKLLNFFLFDRRKL